MQKKSALKLWLAAPLLGLLPQRLCNVAQQVNFERLKTPATAWEVVKGKFCISISEYQPVKAEFHVSLEPKCGIPAVAFIGRYGAFSCYVAILDALGNLGTGVSGLVPLLYNFCDKEHRSVMR